MKEIWKEVNYCNEYQISNLGNFKKGKKKINGWVEKTGYKAVYIKGKRYTIHRLVAEHFIDKVIGKNVVNHKDGNKLNNKFDNLEWCTQKENVQHAFKTGLMDNAMKIIPLMKVRAKRIGQFDEQNKFIREFKGSVEAQKELNKNGIKVNARNIRSVCEGKRQKAGGYYWRYL